MAGSFDPQLVTARWSSPSPWGRHAGCGAARESPLYEGRDESGAPAGMPQAPRQRVRPARSTRHPRGGGCLPPRGGVGVPVRAQLDPPVLNPGPLLLLLSPNKNPRLEQQVALGPTEREFRAMSQSTQGGNPRPRPFNEFLLPGDAVKDMVTRQNGVFQGDESILFSDGSRIDAREVIRRGKRRQLSVPGHVIRRAITGATRRKTKPLPDLVLARSRAVTTALERWEAAEGLGRQALRQGIAGLVTGGRSRDSSLPHREGCATRYGGVEVATEGDLRECRGCWAEAMLWKARARAFALLVEAFEVYLAESINELLAGETAELWGVPCALRVAPQRDTSRDWEAIRALHGKLGARVLSPEISEARQLAVDWRGQGGAPRNPEAVLRLRERCLAPNHLERLVEALARTVGRCDNKIKMTLDSCGEALAVEGSIGELARWAVEASMVSPQWASGTLPVGD